MKRILSMVLCSLPCSLLLLFAQASPEAALRLGGYGILWYQYEDAPNGVQQSYSKDLGAQEASGFNLYKARLSARAQWENAGFNVLVKMEGGSPSLLDAYGYIRILDGALELDAGQMKIPSEWETAVSDDSLDFATRSRFAAMVGDYSLCRSSTTMSPLYNVQTQGRDLGFALKGELRGLGCFVMVGNGLGANEYIGAYESPQFIFANKFGAYFYGAQLSYDLFRELDDRVAGVPASLVVGGHYNRNIHPNLIMGDKTTVLDLDRVSWSANAELSIFDRLRIGGMYGEGAVNDNYDNIGGTDYAYKGWELRAMGVVVKEFLEVGLRYDCYDWDRAIVAGWTSASALTLGVNLICGPHLRFQFNYRQKTQTGTTQLASTNVFLVTTQIKL